MKPFSLQRLKREIRRLDPKLTSDDPAYRVALILLAALVVGANIRRVARFTGFTYQHVTEVGRRLRANGVWRGSRTICEWFEKKGGYAFWLDTNVGLGTLDRS
jgi:hypothetical protein